MPNMLTNVDPDDILAQLQSKEVGDLEGFIPRVRGTGYRLEALPAGAGNVTAIALTIGRMIVATGALSIGDSTLTEAAVIAAIAAGAAATAAITALQTSVAVLQAQKIPVTVIAGTSYSVTDADSGTMLLPINGAAVTITVDPSCSAGVNVLVQQYGAGTVSIVASGGGGTRHAPNGFAIAGQYRTGNIFVNSNAGAAPDFTIGGDVV